MKYHVRFFVIILITCCITIANANEFSSIVYINMDKVMKKSAAGKSLIEQLEKMGATEEAIRLRWGMILDYFGTVFYLVGDRPRAIECYELAKQVLPNDKKIAENIVRAKS